MFTETSVVIEPHNISDIKKVNVSRDALLPLAGLGPLDPRQRYHPKGSGRSGREPAQSLHRMLDPPLGGALAGPLAGAQVAIRVRPRGTMALGKSASSR